MIEGLWSVEIGLKDTEMQGAGVVVFENQCILGGTGDYFFTGKYEMKDGAVHGEVKVKFCGRKTSPIFRLLPKFRVRFVGKVRRVMDLQNLVVEDSKKEILIRLTKRAELS